MLPALAIAPPLIGPFIDRTKLTGETAGGKHLGVAIWWSSPLGSMRGDLVRTPDSTYWIERLAFSQWPEFDFEEVFDAFFPEPTPRLFEFLNELGEFLRLSEHATLHSKADSWLNPVLVRHGFSLGHSRAHRRGVTTPLVWVFRHQVKTRWLGMPYVGVDYLEWSEAGTRLRRGNYVACGGFASNALFRFTARFASDDHFQWLTREGELRMRHLFKTARAKRIAKAHSPATPPSANEAATLRMLRRHLKSHESPAALTRNDIAVLSDKGFLRLLRSGIAAAADEFCAALLSLRSPAPQLHEDLLGRFVDNRLLKSAEALLLVLPKKRGGFDAAWRHLLSRAAETGGIPVIKWALQIAPPDNARALQYAIERAARTGPSALAFLLEAPEAQHLIGEAMLHAFRSSVFCQEWDEASLWLDRGLRPFSVEGSEDARLDELLRPGGLPILQKIFAVEHPTDANLTRLLGGCVFGGAETEFFLELSRTTPGHAARMSRLLYQTVMAFIRFGRNSAPAVIERAVREGASLRDYSTEFATNTELLRGYGWRDCQERLIAIVGELRRAGAPEDAKVVASVRRGMGRRAESTPSARSR